MTKAERSNLADKITTRLKVPPRDGSRKLDAEVVRDCCDLLSGGDLDCASLDILQDMVQARLSRFGIEIVQ